MNDQEETTTLLQMFVLLYADDTLLLIECAGHMQKALDATVRFCELNRMSLNIQKTKYLIFFRGKVRKVEDITIYDTPIERVDNFCYLGIVFRHNNTFQNAIKHNMDRARKAMFKISVSLNEVNLDVKTRIHLFDMLILPILLHGCELWGFKNVVEIEVFHRKSLSIIFRVRKTTPSSMVYGELGRYELRYMI